jgi:hypothetical protein
MTQLEGKKIVVLGGSREHALPQAAGSPLQIISEGTFDF